MIFVVEIAGHFGLDNLRLGERPMLEPGPRDVRVRVRAGDAFEKLGKGVHFGKIVVKV